VQLSEIYQQHDCVVSCELFPPKTFEVEVQLFTEELPRLLELSPGYITCTYGAGGGTRDKTLDIVSRVKNVLNKEAAAHLTFGGSSKKEISGYLQRIRDARITNVVALRGDPPKGDDTFRPHPDGFGYAVELVRFIKEQGDFDVAVAGYPEGHPECSDKMVDWQRCREKVDAGADVVITQLFYDPRLFLEFRDHLREKLKIEIPIVPGILPILSTPQIKRFCNMCGSSLPPDVMTQLEKYKDDPDSCRKYGVEQALDMCMDLIRHGVDGLHFYVLNRAPSAAQIIQHLGLYTQ
jgi:methylenetetrahydrofolate reductase (NADPH)